MSGEPIDIKDALRRAFNLGQTYWQQADSDSHSQNSKSEATRAKFNVLVADVAAATPPARLHAPPEPPEPLTVERLHACLVVACGDGSAPPLDQFDSMEEFPEFMAFARAIEAAHGITAAPAAPKEQA